MEWKSSISTLSEIVKSQSHAAFSALTHAWAVEQMDIPQTGPAAHLPSTTSPWQRAENRPTSSTYKSSSTERRRMCPLWSTCKIWWFGYTPTVTPCREGIFCSQLITAPLRDHILNQEEEYYDHDILDERMQRRAQVSSDNKHRCQGEADAIHQQLPEKLQKAMILAKQKGASSWLTTLPLTGSFQDVLERSGNRH